MLIYTLSTYVCISVLHVYHAHVFVYIYMCGYIWMYKCICVYVYIVYTCECMCVFTLHVKNHGIVEFGLELSMNTDSCQLWLFERLFKLCMPQFPSLISMGISTEPTLQGWYEDQMNLYICVRIYIYIYLRTVAGI